MKLINASWTLIFFSFPAFSAVQDYCDEIDLNPDISKSEFVYVNPNASCDLSFNLPGLPSRAKSSIGGGDGDAGCGIFHEYASEALAKAESKLADQMSKLSPQQAEYLQKAMDSSYFKDTQNAVSDALGGKAGDFVKTGSFTSSSINAEKTVENVKEAARDKATEAGTNIIRKSTAPQSSIQDDSTYEERWGKYLYKPEQGAAGSGSGAAEKPKPNAGSSTMGNTSMESFFR